MKDGLGVELKGELQLMGDINVQSPHLPGYLGWVDLDLGCSTILIGQ